MRSMVIREAPLPQDLLVAFDLSTRHEDVTRQSQRVRVSDGRIRRASLERGERLVELAAMHERHRQLDEHELDVGPLASGLTAALDGPRIVAQSVVAGRAPHVERPDAGLARAESEREIHMLQRLGVPFQAHQAHTAGKAARARSWDCRSRFARQRQRPCRDLFAMRRARASDRWQRSLSSSSTACDRPPRLCRRCRIGPAVQALGNASKCQGGMRDEVRTGGNQELELLAGRAIVLLREPEQQRKGAVVLRPHLEPTAVGCSGRRASTERTSKSIADTMCAVTSSWMSNRSAIRRS